MSSLDLGCGCFSSRKVTSPSPAIRSTDSGTPTARAACSNPRGGCLSVRLSYTFVGASGASFDIRTHSTT
jgi:hypothetical protein